MKIKFSTKSINQVKFSSFLATFCLLLSLNVHSKIELLDRVVAVVDSGVIMESQLNSRVEEILQRLKNSHNILTIHITF